MRQRIENADFPERLPGKPVAVQKGSEIFRQGQPAEYIFYLKSGRVKLTAVSVAGRQATVEVIEEGSFFGETCFASNPRHRATATALTACSILRLNRSQLLELVHEDQPFAQLFIYSLAQRAVQYEDNLLDQLLNSSERRLARALLVLAHFGEGVECEKLITGVSHEALAEMVGTTRAHITVFMNKFRHLGMVEYDRKGIRVRPGIMRLLLGE
jgi:CRP/FNR family transcriptional regulator, cyclic AMP receptor protein